MQKSRKEADEKVLWVDFYGTFPDKNELQPFTPAFSGEFLFYALLA